MQKTHTSFAFLTSCPDHTATLNASQKKTKHQQPDKKDTDMAAIETTRTPYGTLDLVARINVTLSPVIGTIASWNDARVTRNTLSGLSDRELDDIGLGRGDIDRIAKGATRY